MGESKPSQYPRHLKNLVPDVPDDILRSLWPSRLPSHIQTILAGQAEGKLDSASQLADRIAEVAPLPTTAPIAQAPDSAELLQKIEDLARQVAALSSERTRHRSNSRSRQRERNTTPADSLRDQGHCWYHRRFKDEARRCTPPCSYNEQGNGSNRR
jgi:hypothetical protein